MSGPEWWQRGAIYQVYPRSFADADGAGVGDLRGLVSRLDYLGELGVEAVWLSPIFPSPMADFGYDVADDCDVDPAFSTLADLDELIRAAHARGIRVILDWVPNHTSDRHPWENPEVEAAMHDVLRFWLDRGVDGFRIDVVHLIAKDPDRLRRIRRVADSYPERMLVGEVYLRDLERVVAYVSSGDQLHLAHNFVFLHLPWSASAFRASIDRFDELAEGAWPAWFLENHDHTRVASRFDGDGHGAARARAVLLLLYALRGTPFVYQGEELGLQDAEIPPDRIVDVDGRDPVRAPLPWAPPSRAGAGAGFTPGEPWLPVVAGAERLNVETQAADRASTLALARRLARLRRETPALQSGTQRSLDAGDDVLARVRDERVLAAVNFASAPVPLALPDPATLLLSTDPGRDAGELTSLTFGPSEGVVLLLA